MKKIVVLGAGFAGLKTVVALQKKMRDQVDITLIDRNDFHYETIRLYEVASGENPYTKMSFALADVIKPKMTHFIQDEVRRINPHDKTVELGRHAAVKYDYLVVGLGFTLSDFGIPGVKENALPMFNVKTAEAIHDHLVAQMKDYQKTKNPNDLKIIVCGAGFQAIELASALASSRERFAKIAGVAPQEITIKMLDGSTRLLPMFGKKQLAYATKTIKENGIEIIQNARIKRIYSDQVVYSLKDDPTEIKMPANNIIWMMGFSGSPVVEKSGFKTNRGRVLVNEHLTDPAHPDIYFLGDVSSVMIPGKKWPYPNTGQLALSMANYAAKDLAARIQGHNRPNPYEYHDLGVVVDLGERKADALAMGMKFTGYPASALKKIVIDKSIFETGGVKETLAIGRFDFYR